MIKNLKKFIFINWGFQQKCCYWFSEIIDQYISRTLLIQGNKLNLSIMCINAQNGIKQRTIGKIKISI